LRMEPNRQTQGGVAQDQRGDGRERACWGLVGLAAVVGIGLMVETLRRNSATYDEVAYLRVAARWWRTGDQEQITRMGSPLSFWKLQQAPVLVALELAGLGTMLGDPERHQAALLPILRAGSLWIWLVALLLTAEWSRRLYGPRAMALSAWIFALGPNLLAHGSLITMEMPLVACTAGMFFVFDRFLGSGRHWLLGLSAAVGGLALSCKFTTVIYVPILGVCWWAHRIIIYRQRPLRTSAHVALGMFGYILVLLLSNLIVTGFATLPLSERTGEHPSIALLIPTPIEGVVSQAVETPLPQDWVGFITQMRHQRGGGPSYLLGERRLNGWWSYYFVALGVKIPLAFWLLVAGRACLGRRSSSDRMILMSMGLFLAISVLGSSRNYGVRYLLPMAPLAIVWISALAEAGNWARALALAGVVGQGAAVALIHPYELTYFNIIAGGPAGGRFYLADSNLDWGQGLRSLARLQGNNPQYRNLTLYYFGDTKPEYYGVAGICHVIDAGAVHPKLPKALEAETRFVAVSASLKWGPWGPADYFQVIDNVEPVAWTDDRTIAIYRTSDLRIPRERQRGLTEFETELSATQPAPSLAPQDAQNLAPGAMP
jgi:hypothetical protein